MYYGGSLDGARESHPVGSIEYTNYPQEGFYEVLGYRMDEVHGQTEILGRIVIKTDFGYPDDSCRGEIIALVINRKRGFARAPSLGGQWVVSNI